MTRIWEKWHQFQIQNNFRSTWLMQQLKCFILYSVCNLHDPAHWQVWCDIKCWRGGSRGLLNLPNNRYADGHNLSFYFHVIRFDADHASSLPPADHASSLPPCNPIKHFLSLPVPISTQVLASPTFRHLDLQPYPKNHEIPRSRQRRETFYSLRETQVVFSH